MFVTFYNMKRLLFLIMILLLSVNALATHVAVLETMADGAAKDSLSLTDRQYLTNVLREQAVKELPAEQNFTIMTRENINAMLPPGKAIEDCEGSCLAETGRNIAADYVCQARVGRFGSKLTLSAELYETAGNKLVTSFNGRGADVEELLKLIEEKSPDFFRRVKELAGGMMNPNSENESVRVESRVGNQVANQLHGWVANNDDEKTQGISANESESLRSHSHRWDSNAKQKKSRSFLLFSVRTICLMTAATGVVLAVVGNNMAKDASKKSWDTLDEYEKYHQDAKDYQQTRTVGIGLAIAGAVGFGVSFAF